MEFLRYVWQPVTPVSNYQIPWSLPTPPPPSTPSPHLNCTSHNSANWPGISSRTITVITDLCQAPKPLSRVSWGSGIIFTISTFRLNFVLYFFFWRSLLDCTGIVASVESQKRSMRKNSEGRCIQLWDHTPWNSYTRRAILPTGTERYSMLQKWPCNIGNWNGTECSSTFTL